jgi:hypothetical protein
VKKYTEPGVGFEITAVKTEDFLLFEPKLLYLSSHTTFQSCHVPGKCQKKHKNPQKHNILINEPFQNVTFGNAIRLYIIP